MAPLRTLPLATSSKLFTAVPVLLAVWFAPADAHASVRTCIKAFTAGQLKADSVGERLVREVASSIGIHRRITVIACDDGVSKAAADEITHEEASDDVPLGEYIVFNSEWLREVVGDQSEPGQPNRVPAIATFGHELGHLLYRHFDLNSNKPIREIEAEADHFAGCAVASDGGSWERLEEFLRRIRAEKDELYPDRLTSLDAAREGFKACRGGSLNETSEYDDMLEEARETPIIGLPDGLYCGRSVSDLEIDELVGIMVQTNGCDINSEQLGFVVGNYEPEIPQSILANPKRIKARSSCYPVNFRDEAKRYVRMLEEDLSRRERAAECRLTLLYYRLIKSQYLEDLDEISTSYFVGGLRGDSRRGMFTIESIDGRTKRQQFNQMWDVFNEQSIEEVDIVNGVFDARMLDRVFSDKLRKRLD